MHWRSIKFVILIVVFLLTLSACSSAEVSNLATMTVAPARGPSGTTGTITIAGALSNAPLTLELGVDVVSGQTDAKGSWSYQHTFNGQVGEVLPLKVIIGPASEQSLTGNFFVPCNTISYFLAFVGSENH